MKTNDFKQSKNTNLRHNIRAFGISKHTMEHNRNEQQIQCTAIIPLSFHRPSNDPHNASTWIEAKVDAQHFAHTLAMAYRSNPFDKIFHVPDWSYYFWLVIVYKSLQGGCCRTATQLIVFSSNPRSCEDSSNVLASQPWICF